MSTTVEPTVQWSQDQMVQVLLNEPDDFLKVRETLTRIGVASRKEKKLYQSCHILHKQGDITSSTSKILLHWTENMLTLLLTTFRDAIVLHVFLLTGDYLHRKRRICSDIAPLNQIKVLSYKDKSDWILEQKYNIGKKGKTRR